MSEFIKKVVYEPIGGYEGILIGGIIWIFINWFLGESWIYGLVFFIINLIISILVVKFFCYRKVSYVEIAQTQSCTQDKRKTK